MKEVKRSPNLTDHEKATILAGYERGTNIKDIASLLGIKESTISSFYSRFMKDFGFPPKEIRKKSMITAAMGLAIKKMANESKNFGVRRMALQLKVSIPNQASYPSFKTIHRYLQVNNYVAKKHQLKPFINERNRLKRIAFAEKWVGEDLDKLGVVIWSDETMVRSHPFTRRHVSWVPQNQEAPQQEKHHSGKYSVMFWGCISEIGRGPLIVVEGTMDAKKYQKVLKDDLLGEAKFLAELGINAKIMHDNAPAHASRLNQAVIDDCEFEFLDWPPYSPDLNPIENVWAWVKLKLYSDFPPATSEQELIDFVFEIWGEIDEEMCQKFCGNYNKRLLAVLKSKGLKRSINKAFSLPAKTRHA